MRNQSSLVLAAAVALALGHAPTAMAQLEEIIVSAQKFEESAQDIGLTISAFDADSYRELTGGTLDGLTSQLTNTQAYANNTFLQSVHIRGIGLNEFQGQYDSPVARHVDEVYIAKPWMSSRRQYDIQRVEVLKGPQGTLFGRNTTGGAVNFYTNAPTDAFEAALELGADEHERYSLQGMVSGPLSERLSGRLSFLSEFGSGGPQKNLYSGKEHGEPDLLDFRGQLRWTGDRLTVRVLVNGGTDQGEKVAWKGPGIFNFGAPGFCPELFTGEVSRHPSSCAKSAGFATLAGFPEGEYEPEDKHTINQNTPPKVDDTFYGGYLRLDYELGQATLTSITAYQYYERIHREDSQSDIFDSTSTHYYNEIDQFTQELRLTGEVGGKSRYVLGLFYEHDDLEQVDGSDLSGQPLPGVVPPFADQFFAQFHQELDSYAVFSHFEYGVSDEVTLNLGLRYTSDKTSVDDVLLGLGNLPQTGKQKFVTPCLITTFFEGPIGSPACPFLGPFAPLYADSRTDENFSWRLGLEWTPQDDLLVYANLTTGYRGGGYSLPFAGAATSFDPEEIFAQEVGIKSQFLDRRLQLNATLFHFEYDDVQVNVDDPVSPLVPITRNVGKQENLGAELELTWQPSERWLIKQGLGYLDAEYQDTARAISTYAGIVPLEGKTPVNSPEWTYNGVLRYEQPVAGNWNGALTLDYHWVDERFLEATNQVFDRAAAYWLVNLRAALATQDGKWEVAVYAKNLFDEEYLTYINNIGFFKLDIFGEQRTVGATLRHRHELWELDATSLAAAIRRGEASARDAVTACLGRIAAVNGQVNAITAVHGDEALAAAAAADERQATGAPLGPLHGVPFAVKENIDTQGWPTTQGVPAMAGAIAPRDAPIVEQLRAAGAIPVAATNLPDFGLRWHTESSLRGATRNPWAHDRTPGGSSGGSAVALATGMVPLALGNDLGGSLRVPAQYCGVASLRPSHGRIARAIATMPGELPLSFQLMYVEGPMARSVADLEVALAAASHADARDPWWVPAPLAPAAAPGPARIALVLNPGGLGVDPQVESGVRRAAAVLVDAGYAVEEAEPPQLVQALRMWQCLLFNETRALMLGVIRQFAGANAVRALTLCDPFIPEVGRDEMLRTYAERTALLRQWLAFFERYPLVLGPVSTAPPFLTGADVRSTADSERIMNSMCLVVTANLLGLPVAVVPTGVADGLPQAVQIIGAPFSEARCLAAAAAIESALGTITPPDGAGVALLQ